MRVSSIRIAGAAGARHAGKTVVDRPASRGISRLARRPRPRSITPASICGAAAICGDGQAVFNLLVFATFAESLWHTMLDAAAEYGVDVGAGRFGLTFAMRRTFRDGDAAAMAGIEDDLAATRHTREGRPSLR